MKKILQFSPVLIFLLAACTISTPTAVPSPSSSPTPAPFSLESPSPASTPSPIPLSPTPLSLESPLPVFTPSPTTLSPASPPLISPANASELVRLAEVQFEPWELVQAIDWSPDGEMLAVSAGPNIYLYSAQDLRRLAVFEAGSLTHSLAFSPDGRRLAAGSRDGRLRLWEVPSIMQANAIGEPVMVLEAHKKGVNCLAFSPDGLRLASGGNDAVVRLWDIATGEMLSMIIGGTYAVPGIAFRPGGPALAIVNGDVVRFREVESGRIVGSLRADTWLYSLAFHPDGELLAVGDGANTIRLWPIAAAASTSPDASLQPVLFTGPTGKSGSSALVWKLAFSPDGRLLASAVGDGTLYLWDVLDAELVASIIAHAGGTTSLAFSPNGRWLASGGLDGKLRLWGAGEGQ